VSVESLDTLQTPSASISVSKTVLSQSSASSWTFGDLVEWSCFPHVERVSQNDARWLYPVAPEATWCRGPLDRAKWSCPSRRSSSYRELHHWSQSSQTVLFLEDSQLITERSHIGGQQTSLDWFLQCLGTIQVEVAVAFEQSFLGKASPLILREFWTVSSRARSSSDSRTLAGSAKCLCLRRISLWLPISAIILHHRRHPTTFEGMLTHVRHRLLSAQLIARTS
jgi:hypothetical protein